MPVEIPGDPWSPLPRSDGNLPTRRGKFIDVEVFGNINASSGTLGDLTLTGTLTVTGTISGGTFTGGDIYSTNWDGTIPANLATVDTGASAGFYLDASTGAAQFEGDIFVRGDIIHVGTFTADSGTAAVSINPNLWTSEATIEFTDDDTLFTGKFSLLGSLEILQIQAGNNGTDTGGYLTLYTPDHGTFPGEARLEAGYPDGITQADVGIYGTFINLVGAVSVPSYIVFGSNAADEDFFSTSHPTSGSASMRWTSDWLKMRFGGTATPLGLQVTDYDNTKGVRLGRSGKIYVADGSSGWVEVAPKGYIAAATAQATTLTFTTTETKFGEQTIACDYASQPVLVEVHVWARASIQAANYVWVRAGINGTAQGTNVPLQGVPTKPSADASTHNHSIPILGTSGSTGAATAGTPHTHSSGSITGDSDTTGNKDPAITVTAGAANNVTVYASYILETTADGSGDVKVSAHAKVLSGSIGGTVQVAYKISRR